MRKVTLYIATSKDGFIADKDGGVEWLPQPSEVAAGEDVFGYNKLLNQISIICMGSNSYKQIIGFGEWAWPNKMTYVFTSQSLTTEKHYISFVHEDVDTFMKGLNPNQNIWLLGGADLVLLCETKILRG